jgi:N-acetyl-gamma-glutamyl-phosphate reductase
MQVNRLAVWILGASGFGGGELLRLLAGHPNVAAIQALSRSHAGEPLFKVHPNLRGIVDGEFRAEADWRNGGGGSGPIVVFSAMPHFELARRLPELETAWAEAGIADRLTLIDLSGDFRLADPATYEAAYGRPHPCPERLGDFVYGLSEWRPERLSNARRIANPGCFASAIELGLLPLASVPGIDFIAVNAVTGSSGSGASPSAGAHHPLRTNDFRAYKILAHQHMAEITALLATVGLRDHDLSFVPHSAPLVRGIFATIQFRLPRALDGRTLRERFEAAYRSTPFVRLVEASPRLAAVAGSNFCDIGIGTNDRQAVIMVALDNLMKGMAGQAVQNLNLALNLKETAGLWFPGRFPG